MPGDTTRYSFPYQSVGDPPDGPSLGQDLAEAIEAALGPVDDAAAAVTADWNTKEPLLDELFASASVYNYGPVSPLVSAANTDTLVTSMSYTFKTGYAYEINYSGRFQIVGGTSPFVAYVKLRRGNASGTLIHDPGGTAMVGSNFLSLNARYIVKRTGANTSQTIAMCAGFSTSGGPSSLDLEAASQAPAVLSIRCIGYAANHGGAAEIATA